MTVAWRKCFGGYTLILVVFGVITACGGPESDLISLTSPKGLYEVRIHGDFDLPTRMFTSHWVRLEVLHEGKRHTEPIVIHHADLLDTAFSERYHSPSWVSENVLRFKSGVAETTAVDKLKIHNRSGRDLRQAIVRCTDLVVLLDLKAGETSELPVTAYRNVGTVFVGVEGLVNGVLDDRGAGADFEPAQPEPWGAQHYVLEVTIMPDHISLAVYRPNGEAARRLSEYNR